MSSYKTLQKPGDEEEERTKPFICLSESKLEANCRSGASVGGAQHEFWNCSWTAALYYVR